MDKKTKPRRNSEKRREKSRDAARQRRNQETHIFTELANSLPLAKGKTRQLDKASIMRLTLCLMKQHEIRLREKDIWQALSDQKENCNDSNNQQQLHQSHLKSITNDDQSDTAAVSNNQPFSPKNNSRTVEDKNQPNVTDHSPGGEHSSMADSDLDENFIAQLYAKALDGFVIILSRDGEIVDVSEHVGRYLGIQQIDLLGQNIYDYIHPCDHEQLRSELGPFRAHRMADVDTWPSPRQVFSLRVKSTLTAKGRNINLKSASYKVIKFSGQLLCPAEDIDTFRSSSTTFPTSSSSTSSSTVCLPCLSSSPLDKAALQKKLAKQVAVSTDADKDIEDEFDGNDDDDDVVVVEKEFKSEADDDIEYSGEEIKMEKLVTDNDNGGKEDKYEGDSSRGGSGSYDQSHQHHPNKHPPHRHCLQSEHLAETSSSLHHHQQQQSLSSTSSSPSSPVMVKKEKENGSLKCEVQFVDNGISYLLQLPLHHQPPSQNNNDNIKIDEHADVKDSDTGSHREGGGVHHHQNICCFRDNLKQKQDEDDEAKSYDSGGAGDAAADEEHKDSKCDDTSKTSSPCATPASRSRHVSGNSTDNSSVDTGRVRTSTAYFVAFGEPIPHPSNIEVPLGSQTFLSQHSMDMRFTIWDEKIKELVGYTSEDIIGHSIYEYYHGLDAEMVGQAFKELMTKGQITTGQYRFLAKQGGHVWLITQATVIYDNRTQKPLYVVCVHSVLSEIENQHEILSIVQQPPPSQSQPSTKQSCDNSNSKHTSNHSNHNNNVTSSSTSTSATKKISIDCTPSYTLLVAPKVATSETESQYLKCKKESVDGHSSGGHGSRSHLDVNNNDDARRSKDGKSSSSLACKMSKPTPTDSLTSSSHLLVLSKLGDLVSQREGGLKTCDSGYYGYKDDKRCNVDDFGSNKEDMQQQGGQGNIKKVKRKATNNEEERVSNNNTTKNNDYRCEKAKVKEENGIKDVVSCKDSAICGGQDEHDEENSRKMKWRKKGSIHIDGVVVNAFDIGIEAKMDVDETGDGCVIGDGQVKETDETKMDQGERRKKVYDDEVVVTEVVMANDFDTETNDTIIEASESGVETDVVEIIDAGVKDKEMDWRKKNNENDNSTVEMKVDDRDNRFDIGIRDYRNQASSNGNCKEDNEMTMLEIPVFRQKAESNRQRKTKKMKDDLNCNDPTKMSMSVSLPMITKKKKKTTTKTTEFVKSVTGTMKDVKTVSQESKVFDPCSLEYSLTSNDFSAVPPALVRDDDAGDIVVAASTEDSRRCSPQSGSILGKENSDNRGINSVSSNGQQNQSHRYHYDHFGSSHSPGPLLNTEKIFAPRTKDMDEVYYINKNINTNLGTIPTPFINEANNKNNNGNSNTTSSNDPEITGSNGSGGSSTTNVTNMFIDDFAPTTTLLLDEQGDCSSTAGCINAFDDLTFRAPSAGDVCIDLPIPPNFETAFKVPTLDGDETYINEVSMTEMCDNKPQCLQVPDLSPQLQDFGIEEMEYDILQTTLSSSNEGSLLLSPDIGDMLYSKSILSFANKTETSLDKGLMQTPAFNKSMPLQKSPTSSMLVNTSLGLNPSPNTESNIELSTLALNKSPMITSIQQTPIPSRPNPNGSLQGGEELLHKVALNMSSQYPTLQQLMETEHPRTMKSNMSPNNREAEELLRQMLALNKEGPPLIQQSMMTEQPGTPMLSSPYSKLQPEKLLKYIIALKKNPGALLSEVPPSVATSRQVQQVPIPIPNQDPGSNLKSNANQTLLHVGKELSVQPVPTKLKGPTPGKVRRLESMIMPEEAQIQGRRGDGGGTGQQGFGGNTAQTRQLINEYGSSNSSKDSVLRNLLVNGEDRNNGYFVNQHIGLPYLMTQTQAEPPPKLDSSFTPSSTDRRQSNKNTLSVNTAATAANPIGNQHDNDNNTGSSMSPNSGKPTTNQQKQQNWVWWWALNTTVTSPTLTAPSSIISTSSSTSSKDNVRVSNSAKGTTTNNSMMLESSSPSYDKRALFGEDLVGVGQLDQRELNVPTRVSNSFKGTTTTTISGSLSPNSLLLESPSDMQVLFGEKHPQTKQLDLATENTSFDDSHCAKSTTTVTGTIANPTAASSSNNDSSSSTRRMSSNLFDDIRALLDVDLIPGGPRYQGSNSTEDTSTINNMITTSLSNNALPNAKSSLSLDFRTLFGVDLIPAGQLNLTNESDRVSNSGKRAPPTTTITTTTNDKNEDGNSWDLVAGTTVSISDSATNSPRDAEKEDFYEYNDNDDDLLVANSISMATESLSEAEQSPTMSPPNMTGIRNKNNLHNNRNIGIRAPNTQSSAVLQNNDNNNNMKYRVKIPKYQNTYSTGMTTASKWLPRLTQTDCEVNAPVWKGERLLKGTELLRALDVENIF